VKYICTSKELDVMFKEDFNSLVEDIKDIIPLLLHTFSICCGTVCAFRTNSLNFNQDATHHKHRQLKPLIDVRKGNIRESNVGNVV